MSQNKSVEEVVRELKLKHPLVVKYKSKDTTIVDFDYMQEQADELFKDITEILQTSQEREREIVGKLFEALDYQNTERELNAKEEDRMGIKLALQQFKLKFLTEYNITLNPNKD